MSPMYDTVDATSVGQGSLLYARKGFQVEYVEREGPRSSNLHPVVVERNVEFCLFSMFASSVTL